MGPHSPTGRAIVRRGASGHRHLRPLDGPASQCRRGGNRRVKALLVSQDGRMLAVQEDLTTIGIWELPPRKPLTWFALVAAILALPLAGLAWRR